MKRSALGVLALASFISTGAYAVSCGTVAAPTACTISVGIGVGGTTKYNFTGFSFGSASATGGGTVYGGADISIDLFSGGGLSAILTFSKNNVNPGLVFVANSGQAAGFNFSYNVTLSPVLTGTVDYLPPFGLDLNGATKTSNASGAVQWSIPGAPFCQAIVGIASNHANCTILAGQVATISVSNIVSLAGNMGNVGMSGFTNAFNATFKTGPIDIDGDNHYGALTDGLLLLRYLFGLRGASLISGAVGVGATRFTALDIEQYIASLMP